MILRQGDVLMVKVSDLPKEVTEAEPENNDIILAHGEVTGHAHRIKAPINKAKLWDAGAERFLQVMEGCFVTKDVVSTIVGENGRPFVLGHERLPGVALQHEEHTAQVIPPGIYRVAIQTEYSPQELRRVAD